MDLSKVSREDLEQIVQRQIKEGLLPADSLQTLLMGSQEFKDAVEYLHTIACPLNHDTDECRFYEESQSVDCWDLRFHNQYSDQVIEFCKSFSCTPRDLLASMREATTFASEIKKASRPALVWSILAGLSSTMFTG